MTMLGVEAKCKVSKQGQRYRGGNSEVAPAQPEDSRRRVGRPTLPGDAEAPPIHLQKDDI